MGFQEVMRVISEVTDRTGQKTAARIKRANELEDKLIEQQATGLQQIMTTDPDPEARKNAADALRKLYSGKGKAAKQTIDFYEEGQPVRELLSGAQPPSQQSQVAPPNITPDNPAPEPGPENLPQLGQPPSVESRTKRTGSIGEFIASRYQSPEQKIAAAKKAFKDAGIEVTDDALVNMFSPRNVTSLAQQQIKVLKPYIGEDKKQHTPIMQPDGTVKEVVSDAVVLQRAFRPVNTSVEMSVEMAKQLRDEDGKVFLGSDGKEINLENLGADGKLKAVLGMDGQPYWMPAQQTQSTITANNVVRAVNQYEKTDPEAGTNLGVSRVPTVSTHEQALIDPSTGQAIAVPLKGTTTPVTPGSPPSTTPKPAPARTTPTTPPTTPSTPSAPSTSTTPGPAGSRPLLGIPPAMYNQWAGQRLTPVREASNQLFGDPSQPSFRGLKYYAPLADNPKSSANVGSAVKATLDSIDQDEKAHGSLINLLKMYSGVPQELVAAKVATMQSIIAKLTPEEHAAYAAEMAAYGTMIGLRSLTKAGAYEFSTRAIQNELPILGWNVKNSQEFYNMMTRLAQEIWGGARVLPAGMISDEEMNHYKTQVGEMSELAKSSALVPPPPGARSARPPLSSFKKKE